MDKKQFINTLAEKLQIPRTHAEKMHSAFIEIINDELAAGGNIKLTGIGTFTVGERAGREGRNPQTGEPLTIPPCKAVKFKTSETLKQIINS